MDVVGKTFLWIVEIVLWLMTIGSVAADILAAALAISKIQEWRLELDKDAKRSSGHVAAVMVALFVLMLGITAGLVFFGLAVLRSLLA